MPGLMSVRKKYTKIKTAQGRAHHGRCTCHPDGVLIETLVAIVRVSLGFL